MQLDTPNPKRLQTLRIAWTDEFDLYPVAQTINSTIQSVAKKLAETTTHVEKWVPKFDFVAAWQVYFVISAYLSLYSQSFDFDYVRDSTALMFREATQGDRALRKLSNVPGIAFPVSLNPTVKGYFEALTERDRLIAHMERELEQCDVLLCPVAMIPAFTHRAKGEAVEVDGRKVPYLMASGAYTIPFSFTGHPVVVIPIGQTKDGLPIGMQVVGKRWRDMELLAIAQEINKVVGDFQHPSGY